MGHQRKLAAVPPPPGGIDESRAPESTNDVVLPARLAVVLHGADAPAALACGEKHNRL